MSTDTVFYGSLGTCWRTRPSHSLGPSCVQGMTRSHRGRGLGRQTGKPLRRFRPGVWGHGPGHGQRGTRSSERGSAFPGLPRPDLPNQVLVAMQVWTWACRGTQSGFSVAGTPISQEPWLHGGLRPSLPPALPRHPQEQPSGSGGSRPVVSTSRARAGHLVICGPLGGGSGRWFAG